MRRQSRRVYLPAGVLRRFRLPEPKAELTGRAAPRTGFGRQLGASLWVALLFALFTSLLYWLGTSETWQLVGETRSSLGVSPNIDEVPNARTPTLPVSTRPSPVGDAAKPGTDLGHEALAPSAESSKRLAPALTGSALADAVSAESTGGAPAAPPDRMAPPRAKPALVVDRHRLRPVVEWRDGRSERP